MVADRRVVGFVVDGAGLVLNGADCLVVGHSMNLNLYFFGVILN